MSEASKGIALLIGVNQVDPAGYDGEWDGKLSFCEADAQAVADVTAGQGFHNIMLPTANATIDGVKGKIKEVASQLNGGDMFVLFYSGHGNSIVDESGDEWGDHKDEAWCLYDGELLDDELYALWPLFDPGVRVLVLSDSCHSGSITRGDPGEHDVVKACPPEVAELKALNDPEVYARVRQQLPKGPKKIGATIRLISGCKDYQQSFENEPKEHGHFTFAVLNAWKDAGNYSEFEDAIDKLMPDYQNPNALLLGANNPVFGAQKPFTI